MANDVTQLLIEYGSGDRDSLDEMFPVVYDELHRIAKRCLGRERRSHTLSPTALVHEAYLRLIDQRSVDWKNKAQFFGIAAQMMRRILVNYAAKRHSAKRGGKNENLPLEGLTIFFDELDFDLLALDEALTKLAARDRQKAEIVELKFFGGLSNEEAAFNLGTSLRTIEREWAFARSWLYKTLTETSTGS